MTSENTARTRRDTLKYGATAAAALGLAGCSGLAGQSEQGTPTGKGSYTVEMFPVGEVEFGSVPESVTTYNMGWADMVVSLGQAEKLRTDRYPAPTLFYDRFDVDYDADYAPLWQDGGWSKETFYERDSDAFLIDPNLLTNWDDNWSQEDTEEIAAGVGPFFGCHNRRIRGEWQQELGYPEQAPSMLEAFDKVGTVLDERARTDAWLDLHADLQSTVQSRLPSDENTPSIGLINSGSSPDKGEFYVLYLEDNGYEMKPYRDLDLVDTDAFAGVETGQYGLTDYEKLLDVDPDIIIAHWGITTGSVTFDGDGAFDAEQFRSKFVEPMANHEVGSELTAVQEGRVLPGPTAEQGPLVNAFQTELTARLLFPEEFGELDLDAPLDVPEDEQLFDRQRVADIINGDIDNE